MIANVKNIGLPNWLVYHRYGWNPSRDERRRFGDGNKDENAAGKLLPLLLQPSFSHGDDKFAMLFATHSSMPETEVSIGTNILVISLAPISALAFAAAIIDLDTTCTNVKFHSLLRTTSITAEMAGTHGFIKGCIL